jgi:hypothetical protein
MHDRYGLKPLGDMGTYFQDVPMVGVRTIGDTSFNFVSADGGRGNEWERNDSAQ